MANSIKDHIEELNSKWVIGISSFYILLNAILTYNEVYWLYLLPPALLIIYTAVYHLDKLILLLFFLTPLSVNIEDIGLGVGVSFPTEPLFFALLILLTIKSVKEFSISSSVIRHPVSIAIIINFIWLTFTAITSEVPVVSIKFLISRLWFIASCYFACVLLFKDVTNIARSIWLYVAALSIIILFSTSVLWQAGFSERIAHSAMTPFFNDHTSYGAVIAMYLPLLFGFSVSKVQNTLIRNLIVVVVILFIVGLVFSYSRAAWLSVVCSLIALAGYLVRIKLPAIIGMIVLAVGILLFFQFEIIMKFEKNDQSYSDELMEHMQSATNISTDQSNLERLNRWSAAFRLFKERPVLGWGPGTYSFVYGPFQNTSDKTQISTNAGDRGNAHSEYIGPLSESGVLGAVTFLWIILAALFTGARLFYSAKDRNLKILVLSILLGLITYLVHGTLNNFLDTDKISVPFWSFIAAIVAIDLYHKKNLEEPATD